MAGVGMVIEGQDDELTGSGGDEDDEDREIKNSDIDKSYRKSQSKLQKVTCGILGCTAKPMLLQNLKDHT